MIEEDFWVCWTLKCLFTLTDAPAELLFKGFHGGTSWVSYVIANARDPTSV
jgi:hypothetical protein